MINSITVTNHLGESLTMDLRSPASSGLQVLSSAGLDPIKADISIQELSGKDGGTFMGSRRNKRNIILRLGLMNNPTIEEMRHQTYKYFPLARQVKLTIETDTRTVYTYGYVEKNSVNIFSKRVESLVSIICPNSFFKSLDTSVVVFSSVVSNFEFPFSNESTSSPLLEMSTLLIETTKTVIYDGDAPTGFVLHIHATGSANSFVLTQSPSLETLAIDSTEYAAIVGSDISNGDDIYISSVIDDKYAIATRGSEEYNILNALGKYPNWFYLDSGDNVFAYNALSGLSNLEFEILHDTLYEGV